MFEQTPPLTPEQEVEERKQRIVCMLKRGITTAQEGATHLAQLQTIRRAPMQVPIPSMSLPIRLSPIWTKSFAEFPLHPGEAGNHRFKIGGSKSRSTVRPRGVPAAFTTLYLTGGPSGEENWKGELFAPQDVINEGPKSLRTQRARFISRKWRCRDRHLDQGT